MRIDYSEPKKSCSAPQPMQNRPRKESSGGGIFATLFVSGIICFVIGFGTGWILSQRSAKKGFKAALEQQSVESTPQQTQTALQQQAPPVLTQQTVAPGSQAKPAPEQGAPDPQFKFYKTLPSGQKNNVLGSGINSKDEITSKQPLQAVMPANLAKPATPQNSDNSQKVTNKISAKQESTGLTVQVASCSLKSEAETYRSKFAAKGYNVNIVESNLGEKGIWYRVHIGKHLAPEEAKELVKKLGKGAIATPDKD